MANKDKIKKHEKCDFGIKSFNKTKRSKEFVREIREKEKKAREIRPYECPAGYEWDLDTNECVPTSFPAANADTQPPSSPQNIRITHVGSTSISLAWDASTDNTAVKGYKIYFKKAGGSTYVVTTRGLVANFQGFLPSTTYYFYVRAFDTGGNLSNPTITVVATTFVDTTTTTTTVAPSTTSTTTLSPSTSTTTTLSSSTTTSTTKVSTVGWAVVYLDFNGGSVSNTPWSAGTIVYSASGMTIAEEEAVLAGVAKDYAAYKVIVTADEAVYNAADPRKRVRVAVTESYEWYCGSTPCAGGVAYIGSMFWGDNTPCWVFSSALSYNVKYVRDATTHEVGHTIGLRHQSVYDANCVKTAEYNPGNTVCDCAPNMGVAYSRTYNQWWVGPNSISCTTIQDDNKIITANIGVK